MQTKSAEAFLGQANLEILHNGQHASCSQKLKGFLRGKHKATTQTRLEKFFDFLLRNVPSLSDCKIEWKKRIDLSLEGSLCFM